MMPDTPNIFVVVSEQGGKRGYACTTSGRKTYPLTGVRDTTEQVEASMLILFHKPMRFRDWKRNMEIQRQEEQREGV